MPYPLADLVAAVLARRYFFTDHAVQRMLEKNIRVEEVEKALGEDAPEGLEEYLDDLRGAEFLILGWTPQGRALHVKIGCAQHRFPDIITAYEPDPGEWVDLRRRRGAGT